MSVGRGPADVEAQMSHLREEKEKRRTTYYGYPDHKSLREVRRYFEWQHPGRRIVSVRCVYPGNRKHGFIVKWIA